MRQAEEDKARMAAELLAEQERQRQMALGAEEAKQKASNLEEAENAARFTQRSNLFKASNLKPRKSSIDPVGTFWRYIRHRPAS